MKPAQFREMSDEHLRLTLNETIKHLFQLRFQSATERLETPSQLKKAKRNVARIKTIQRERELQAAAKETKGSWPSSRHSSNPRRPPAASAASRSASSPATR